MGTNAYQRKNCDKLISSKISIEEFIVSNSDGMRMQQQRYLGEACNV